MLQAASQDTTALRRELDPDETLLWSGMPRQGLLLRRQDAYLIPFSLLWGGFVIFWETAVVSSGAPPFFMIWGIPFVLMGLYIIAGRFFVDSMARARTVYGLTNRRVLIASGLLTRSVKSLQLRTLSDITLDEYSDGRGTISFGPLHPMARWFGSAAWPGASAQAAPSFDLIEGARGVYRSVQDAQREATAR